MLSLLTSASLALTQVANPVTISAGILQGASCLNTVTNSFLGIPFAQPPLGNLRFASPQPYTAKYNPQTYNATTGASACVQFGDSFLESGPTSEDCLYLDVWAPANATNTSSLPVKVWIYGGAEKSGGISNPLYDGCNSAGEDSLVVSINYRLGPLGFLALESAGISGNFGIQDILLGLAWIQSNIAAFGGDPKRVLLFGQSAGATNVFIISTLPQAKSLISAVISESGGGRNVAYGADANSLGALYASSLNCSASDVSISKADKKHLRHISCFRSKSMIDLNTTIPVSLGTSVYSYVNSDAFQPYIDGTTIPAQPSTVGTKVPTVYGSNTNEGQLFVLNQFRGPVITSDNFTTFLQLNFGSAAQVVADAYPLSAFVASPYPAYTAMSQIITDASYFCPAYNGLQLAAQNSVPAWTYLFNHTLSCSWFDFIPAAALPFLGPTHTSEIPFVFGNLDNAPLPTGNCSFTNAEREISSAVITAWTSMAATSNPGFDWPAWNASASLGITVDDALSVGVVNYGRCKFWSALAASTLNFPARNSTTTTNTTTTTTPTPSTHTSTGQGFMQAPISAGGLILLLLSGIMASL